MSGIGRNLAVQYRFCFHWYLWGRQMVKVSILTDHKLLFAYFYVLLRIKYWLSGILNTHMLSCHDCIFTNPSTSCPWAHPCHLSSSTPNKPNQECQHTKCSFTHLTPYPILSTTQNKKYYTFLTLVPRIRIKKSISIILIVVIPFDNLHIIV